MSRVGSVKMCQVYSVEYRTERQFISALAAQNLTPITHGMKDPRNIGPFAAPTQRNLQTHESGSLCLKYCPNEKCHLPFARQNFTVAPATQLITNSLSLYVLHLPQNLHRVSRSRLMRFAKKNTTPQNYKSS